MRLCLNISFCGLGICKLEVFTDLRDCTVSFMGLRENMSLIYDGVIAFETLNINLAFLIKILS